MNVRLLLVLFPLLCVGLPLYAQNPCSDCFNATEGEARKCLESVIGPSERNACLDNRHEQMKACTKNECTVQREQSVTTESQPTPGRPGLGAYTPTEIEWLALVMRAGLRREATTDSPYSLDVVLAAPDTIQLLVRYRPPMTRDSLNKTIDAARDAIKNQARNYGWDKWVKIPETVELYPVQK